MTRWLPDSPNLWPATRLVQAYRRRELSPVEVTDAFRLIDEEAALDGARRSEWRYGRGEPLGDIDGLRQ